MDPLTALREFTIRGEVDKIVRVNDEFRFGNDYSFPCAIKTAYRSKQGNLYTLETLVYYIQNANLKFTDYLQNARALGLPAITFIDRKPLLDYLTGKLSSTDSIVFPLPQQQQQLQQPQQNPNADLAHEYRPDDPAILDSNDADAAGADNGKEEDPVTMIYAMERPLKDRESLLECKNRDFYSVLVASTRREEERQRIESQQRKDGLVAKSRLMGADDRGIGYGDELSYDATPKPKMHLKGGKFGEGVPIILVPSAFQTLITIYNVKEFLEDGIYIPTDVKVKQMKGAKPDCVTVQKKFSTDRNRVMTAYEVRDKPSALKAEDWDRVVAVFVLGKEWQFKDWPFKDHVEIFNKNFRRMVGYTMNKSYGLFTYPCLSINLKNIWVEFFTMLFTKS
ncbi:protein CDC73 homolog isoform X2 [Manihot esculenta]|uniref:protein CDC73 homolog isoform X2 n=1 Tax=Manihot esculenta TaxID=3983 RepID=UPI001CC5C043|nr:protein CDC73 homolog isoform X2 [Manihot esculenta]